MRLTARFHDEVLSQYRDLLNEEHPIHTAFSYVQDILRQEEQLESMVKGPYLEASKSYETVDLTEATNLVSLSEGTWEAIRRRLRGHPLFTHQVRAIGAVINESAPKNIVVSTGTSSGKTLCYQVPILDDLLRNPAPGLRAVIIYPLNALVNDQLKSWRELLQPHPNITCARFTSETPDNEIAYQNHLKETAGMRGEQEGHQGEGLEQFIKQEVERQVDDDRQFPNLLRSRDVIRATPPHVLITNFSMLEYLLERPVDARIFVGNRLHFLVLDEIHSYRGIQATEIAFLLRRLKKHLGVATCTCIGTSATLTKAGDSDERVKAFASGIFGEPPDRWLLIQGVNKKWQAKEPVIRPLPIAYRRAIEALNRNALPEISRLLGTTDHMELVDILRSDKNIEELLNLHLSEPRLFEDVAARLWPNTNSEEAKESLEALLEVAAAASSCADREGPEILPTRLHYFVRALSGLYACLNSSCTGRKGGHPFLTTRFGDHTCPHCQSRLFELVGCRSCGYLFCAVDDKGPSRFSTPLDDAPDEKGVTSAFDDFSTELVWGNEGSRVYFSVAPDFPFIQGPLDETDDDNEEPVVSRKNSDLLRQPEKVTLCIRCGKRVKTNREAVGSCVCQTPVTVEASIFWRQCPDMKAAKKGERKLLSRCPACGARSYLQAEPVRQFREAEETVGTAIAIPFGQFSVTNPEENLRADKLIAFTDNRQKAASFPVRLEELASEIWLGRSIVHACMDACATVQQSITFMDLVTRIRSGGSSDLIVRGSGSNDRLMAKLFSYFGIPDSARKSAEDFGLVAVSVAVDTPLLLGLQTILRPYQNYSVSDCSSVIQNLLAMIRQRKSFQLPAQVDVADPAFGRSTKARAYVLQDKGEVPKTRDVVYYDWLPPSNRDLGNPRQRSVQSDYLIRLGVPAGEDVRQVLKRIWDLLLAHKILLSQGKPYYQLDYEKFRFFVPSTLSRCMRCNRIIPYDARGVCRSFCCAGQLALYNSSGQSRSIIRNWLVGTVPFLSLSAEEHTAQISKAQARLVEESFKREDGISLISSSTTFEMGIDIGELQKVLLRNVPPTSANYVQRVGRAGRGTNRNCVCLTLCRPTPHDNYFFERPADIMQGAIRPPTVFLHNKKIAQRHFNATLFSQFLRTTFPKADKQSIAAAGFFPDSMKEKMPEALRCLFPGASYDFVGWLKSPSAAEIDVELQVACGGFKDGVGACESAYLALLSKLNRYSLQLLVYCEQLSRGAFYREAQDYSDALKKLFKKNIITLLAEEGFLPRYAFPLDVVALRTEFFSFKDERTVILQRDRALAISEFAPDCETVAARHVYTSAGLYIVGEESVPQEQFYYQCSTCKHTVIGVGREELRFEKCPNGCGASARDNMIHPFIQPSEFSVEFRPDHEPEVRLYSGATSVRARTGATQYLSRPKEDDFRTIGRFSLAFKEDGELFIVNPGPSGKGYRICKKCGRGHSEPLGERSRIHKPLRPSPKFQSCRFDDNAFRGVHLGHVFSSSSLVIRPLFPCDDRWSLAYALQRGACLLLELDFSDIGVTWRMIHPGGGGGTIEIVLYDTTPGGAGFVGDANQAWQGVVEKATSLCKDCECAASCYYCLRDYRNQHYHEQLNRHHAIQMLIGSAL